MSWCSSSSWSSSSSSWDSGTLEREGPGKPVRRLGELTFTLLGDVRGVRAEDEKLGDEGSRTIERWMGQPVVCKRE